MHAIVDSEIVVVLVFGGGFVAGTMLGHRLGARVGAMVSALEARLHAVEQMLGIGAGCVLPNVPAAAVTPAAVSTSSAVSAPKS
jgi:hypothetical protein